MQFMCLIYSTEGAGPQPGTEEFGAYIQAYMTYTQNMKEAGKLVAGDALQPIATATTVSLESGQVETVDGPFAETKEQLGGYYLLECEDMEDALKCAADIPTAKHGRIEVRPVMVFD